MSCPWCPCPEKYTQKSLPFTVAISLLASLQIAGLRAVTNGVLRHCLPATALDSSPGVLLSGACVFDFVSTVYILSHRGRGRGRPGPTQIEQVSVIAASDHLLRLSFTEDLASLS